MVRTNSLKRRHGSSAGPLLVVRTVRPSMLATTTPVDINRRAGASLTIRQALAHEHRLQEVQRAHTMYRNRWFAIANGYLDKNQLRPSMPFSRSGDEVRGHRHNTQRCVKGISDEQRNKLNRIGGFERHSHRRHQTFSNFSSITPLKAEKRVHKSRYFSTCAMQKVVWPLWPIISISALRSTSDSDY